MFTLFKKANEPTSLGWRQSLTAHGIALSRAASGAHLRTRCFQDSWRSCKTMVSSRLTTGYSCLGIRSSKHYRTPVTRIYLMRSAYLR